MKTPDFNLRTSFRSKVVGVALVTTVVALLAAFSLFLIQGWSAARQQLVLTRGTAAEVLAYNLSASLVFADQEGARIRLESVRHTPDFRSAVVFDKGGRLFARTGEAAAGVRPLGDKAGATPTWRYSPTTLEYRVPVIVDRERVGELVVISSLDALWVLLRNYLVTAGLSFGIAVGVALITGLSLARIIIEPVSRLARAMDRVRCSGEFEHEVACVSEDEVGHLTGAFNDLLGELKRKDHSLKAAFEDVRASNVALTDSQGAIRNLLDNADQGFLTVPANLVVEEQSSAVCDAILGEAPGGKSIIDLLCREAQDDAASSMRTTLESVFRDPSPFTRELKLELLPAEFAIGNKFIKVGYKFLADSGRLMLILTDVTQTRLLEQEVERERKRLEMIVLAITEGETFAALTNDYRRFLNEELPQMIARFDDPALPSELYRRLHTFKGLLAQFSFPFSPTCLHEVETRLASRKTWTVQTARETFALDALLAEFDRDLAGLTNALGPDFVPSGRHLTLSQSQLQAMEQVARGVLAGEERRALSPPLRLLLRTLAELGLIDVKAALSLHGRGAVGLADRLEKGLTPIVVQGDDVALPPERYGEFFRALVHVFRNAVDHGIEPQEERLLADKPIDGTIRCHVQDRGDEIEIEIADDGAGIDRRRLEDKLTSAGEARAEVAALSLEDLLFRDGLSSRDTVNEVSGRGVGLGAVKDELDRLGGSVTVDTVLGAGTRFHFHLPTGRTAPEREVRTAQGIVQ